MHYAEQPTIVLGADGFVGRHLVATWRARGWPVHPVGRDAGDFTDRGGGRRRAAECAARRRASCTP